MSGEWGRGGPWGHKNPLTALVEAVWRKAGTAARTRFHPKTESEPTDWKYSRRKNRRFCGAGSLTTARSAGSCGVLKGRCSAHEIVALTLFSVEFGCLLRVAKSCWGVPGLLRHEGPFKKCVAENKKLKKTFLHDFYSFFALFALIHIFFTTLLPHCFRVLHTALWLKMWSKNSPVLYR